MKTSSTRGRTSGRAGFTLIELLIVVVIIGILAAIAIPNFQATRERAFRAAMVTDLKNVATHQEIYYGSVFSYAPDVETLGANLSTGVVIDITEASESGWAATATHNSLDASQTCGVFYGDAVAGDGNPATLEGVVTCAEP